MYKFLLTLLIIFFSLSMHAQLSGVIVSNSTSNVPPPPNMNGVWNWVSTFSGNKKADSSIAQYIMISIENNKVLVKATLTPAAVKDRFVGWTLGKSTYTEGTWNQYVKNFFGVPTTGVIEIPAGNFTIYNNKNQVQSYRKYYLEIAKSTDPNDHRIYAVVKETSWNRPPSNKVIVHPGTTVIYSGIWYSQEKEKEEAKAKADAEKNKLKVIDIKGGNKPIIFPAITKELTIKENPPSGNLEKGDRYLFSFHSLEALAVDDDNCKGNDPGRAEYVMDLSFSVNKGSQKIITNHGVVVAKQGVSSSYGYPINNGLKLNDPFLLNQDLYDLKVNANDFNQLSLNIFGMLSEVKPCGGGDFAYTNAVELLTSQTPKSIPFKDLKEGLNSFTLEKNGKKIKITFSITSFK